MGKVQLRMSWPFFQLEDLKDCSNILFTIYDTFYFLKTFNNWIDNISKSFCYMNSL